MCCRCRGVVDQPSGGVSPVIRRITRSSSDSAYEWGNADGVLLSRRQQARNVIAANGREAAIKSHELPAVAPSQSEEVSVGELFAGLRRAHFRHHCRRQRIWPEFVCASVRREDQQLIGSPLGRPPAPWKLSTDTNDAEFRDRTSRPTLVVGANVPS